MDLKALIAKMDQIESKKFLTEGKDWDKDGKVEKPAQEYKGVKDAAIKKAMGKKDKEVDESMINFKGAISQALLREFGLDEEGPGDDGSRFTMTPQEIEAAKAKMTPSQLKWLGGASLDKAILARVPKPLPGEKPAAAPAIDAGATDMSMGAAGAANAADAAAGATDASLGAAGRANASPTAPAVAVGADGTDAGAGGSGSATPATPAAEPAKGGINPTVLNRYKELLDKLEGGAKAPAQPAAKPPMSATPAKQSPKPAQPVSITGEPNQQVGGGTISSLGAGAEESVQPQGFKLTDDRILALIRGM